MPTVKPEKSHETRRQVIRIPHNDGMDELLDVTAVILDFPDYFGRFKDFAASLRHFQHRQRNKNRTGWPALDFRRLREFPRRVVNKRGARVNRVLYLKTEVALALALPDEVGVYVVNLQRRLSIQKAIELHKTRCRSAKRG